MSSVSAKVLRILAEAGVPEADVDGATITVGDYTFAGTVHNTVGGGKIVSARPLDFEALKKRIPAFKKKNRSNTVKFAMPKGSATFQCGSSNTLSVNVVGAENPYASVLHTNFLAMAMSLDGNPSIPRRIRLLHCGIVVKCKGPFPEADINVLYNACRDRLQAQYDASEIPGCQMYVGTSAQSTASATVFGVGNGIATGVPPAESEEYMKVVARLLVYLCQLVENTSGGAPSPPGTTSTE